MDKAQKTRMGGQDDSSVKWGWQTRTCLLERAAPPPLLHSRLSGLSMEVRASSQGRCTLSPPEGRGWILAAANYEIGSHLEALAVFSPHMWFVGKTIQGVAAGRGGEEEFKCLQIGALPFQFIIDPTSSFLESYLSLQGCAFLPGGYL